MEMKTTTQETQKMEQEYSWPELSERERDRRWSRVRELMKSQGLECMCVFGLKGKEQFDGYLTNDRTGGIAIFPLEGDLVQLYWHPQYIVSHLESSIRGESSWVRDVRLGATGAGVVEVLQEKGYDQANIGVVGVNIYGAGEVEGFVPYNTWTYIMDHLPRAKFHEVSRAFIGLVLVKSDEELQLVRRAAQIGELAAETMMRVTRPGISETEIYATVMYQLFLHGANGLNVPYATPMIIQSGPDNPSWGPPIWMMRGGPPRIIQKGDVVQAEIFPTYGRMEAQIQMSIAIEPVNHINKECAAIARKSYETGLKSLLPGKTFGEVVEAMEEPLKQARAWHLTPLIHSQNPLSLSSRKGVGMENLPDIGKYRWKGPTKDVLPDSIIQANTVWELEPNACLGRHRVNIGGTVIVTDKGALSLNMLSTEMRVVG
jgi:Xaa-Pro aminopeptidase